MAGRLLPLTDALQDYVLAHTAREHPVLAELREATAGMKHATMQIGPDQGAFMALLAKLVGARRAIEVGVFTGYSALSVALVLPEDGRLVACDVSEEWTAMARRYWEKAGVARKIELRLAPALQTLDALLAEGAAGTFDFAFIDADKSNYDGYYERVLKLLRPGGVVALDNMLWSGAVADPKVTDADTSALRALNAKIHADSRVDMALATIGDGVMLAVKR